MISQEEMVSIGNSYTSRIIKVEVIEYDKLMENHEVEFRLSTLDIVYSIKTKPDNLDEHTVNKIWMDLFSSFLAAFNNGLSKQKT